MSTQPAATADSGVCALTVTAMLSRFIQCSSVHDCSSILCSVGLWLQTALTLLVTQESHLHSETVQAWQALVLVPGHARGHTVAVRVGAPGLEACPWVVDALGRGPCQGVALQALASLSWS